MPTNQTTNIRQENLKLGLLQNFAYFILSPDNRHRQHWLILGCLPPSISLLFFFFYSVCVRAFLLTDTRSEDRSCATRFASPVETSRSINDLTSFPFFSFVCSIWWLVGSAILKSHHSPQPLSLSKFFLFFFPTFSVQCQLLLIHIPPLFTELGGLLGGGSADNLHTPTLSFWEP